MGSTFGSGRPIRPRATAWVSSLVLLAVIAAGAAFAGATGKIKGKITGTDTGEPLGYADISLLPADTTLHRVGGMCNADGTFQLEAAPGRYTLQIRAMSYATKRVEGIEITAGGLLPFNTALGADAFQQEEIVVEAKARENTEASLLAARKKASIVGDAVSAEQVRKSPDKDAAEVLRRVTGLSVSDGKYVFVRGLGERYSSTEVDGVRIASPEQNKRVVPLDLVPANLLENIVVQKTYTADRAGEFGGGDVQVHTKDFPGNRTWSFSVSQGYSEGVTFRSRTTYPGGSNDLFGFGADARSIPAELFALAGNRKLQQSNDPSVGFRKSTLASIAQSFSDVWSPNSARTIPNGGYSASYGDEFKLFGRPLGVIQSWSFSRSFDHETESQRFFKSASDTAYDYAVDGSTASVQLGGTSGLSYRISPSHSLHVRGLYTNSADDEVRIYQGVDHNRDESYTGTHMIHRGTRLMYLQRSVLSGTIEGKHEFPSFLGTGLDWKVTRSSAKRLQPDRREVIYDLRYDDYPDHLGYWSLGSQGRREFGDLRDNNWGATIGGTVPFTLGALGKGKASIGYDRQSKKRDNFYRRFDIHHNNNADLTKPPEIIFDPATFDSTLDGGYIEEQTKNDAYFTDNYRAAQRTTAGYLSADVPFGRRARGNFGVRVESGFQDVQSFDLFRPSVILQEGKLDDTDWLPSGNLTLSLTQAVNMRLAASRTLSRPDLNELSPSPSLEYVGGFQVMGNPNLKRALIDNYDLRIEAFPGLSEVLAAGVFYKNLHQPIEQVLKGASDPLLFPRNSDDGHNVGVELEARLTLGRVHHRLKGLALNTNAAFISSEVHVKELSQNGSERHPLQGQADHLVNASLSYESPGGRTEMAMLLSVTGRRLKALGFLPLPDVYEQPVQSLDATMGFAPFARMRLKLSAKNLLDPRIRELQGSKEVSSFRRGRGYSIALSYGS
jgi:hypothetical protein